ncbi:MAG: hypothetical protein ABI016_12550 [Chthoniobacterales bacterium]
MTGTTWAGLAAFRLVRMFEQLLPRGLLTLALLPAALVWAVLDWPKSRQAIAGLDRLPGAWRPNRLRFFVRQTIGFAHSRLVYLWPDRMSKRRWIKRCRLKGDFDLSELQEGEQPIIFASIHFGPFRTLPYWLRAHGIVTSAVVGRPISPQGLVLDRLSVPVEIPPLEVVTNIGNLRRSIGPGRRLLIFTDVARGRRVEVPLGEQTFSMATGAIRLAVATGAKLIPCLIVENGVWNFAIHFGPAVPADLLRKGGDAAPAASHLLREWLYVVRHFPVQSRYRFLSSISPAPAGQTPSGDGLWLDWRGASGTP